MKKYILLAAVALSLCACESEDNYIDDPVAARVSATIGDSSLTRAKDSSWEKGDAIGISMSGRYDNIRYATADDDGVFDGSIMYFKNKQESVDITAYYPYTGTEGQAPAVLTANTDAAYQTAAEQSKYDFLYASLEGVKGSDPDVNLQFSHKMSKLSLIFKKGNDGTDVSKITSYALEGLVLDGTFNPATGACAANTGVASQTLAMTPVAVEKDKALPSLLLFPQPVAKLTLKLKDSDNQDYTCELKLTDGRLASGNHYVFTVTVNKTGLAVNPTINPWEESSLEGDAISDDTEE